MRRRVFEFTKCGLAAVSPPPWPSLLSFWRSRWRLPRAARPQDQGKQPASPPTTPPRTSQRKADEFAEAAQAINGPAGNPECVWLGRRVVRLMWRDDLDTAFRHLDLYDRFGCPGGHIQAAFRCLTRFGGQIDPKVAETLDSRVHACWINSNTGGGGPVAMALFCGGLTRRLALDRLRTIANTANPSNPATQTICRATADIICASSLRSMSCLLRDLRNRP